MIGLRNEYIKKVDGLSYQNEPNVDISYQINIRQYPDMFQVYQKFSDILSLRNGNFILANGAENAIKNVLLAIKPKTLSWSKPSWGFMDVYCRQMDIIPINYYFKYDNGSFIEQSFDKDIDAYYNTLNYNNFIQHEQNEINKTRSNENIIDLSYLNIKQIESILKDFDYEKSKTIYVGSFDKMFGCGLRLGFAIFSNKYKEQIQLQREIFINSAASTFILDFEKFNSASNVYSSKIYNYLSNRKQIKYTLTQNFISIYKDIDSQLNHKKVVVDDITITRFGIPLDEQQYEQLIKCLDNVN